MSDPVLEYLRTTFQFSRHIRTEVDICDLVCFNTKVPILLVYEIGWTQHHLDDISM
jgi:hypothetical protein